MFKRTFRELMREVIDDRRTEFNSELTTDEQQALAAAYIDENYHGLEVVEILSELAPEYIHAAVVQMISDGDFDALDFRVTVRRCAIAAVGGMIQYHIDCAVDDDARFGEEA